jgi:hypothetical protein
MAKTRVILHPKTGMTVLPTFAAFGTAERMKGTKGNIKGRLLDAYGHEVSTGTTIHERPNWVILFEGVPLGQGYTLEVTYPTGQPQTQPNIKVSDIFETHISYPGNGAPVCNTFTAYGSVSASSAGAQVSGTLTPTGGGEPIDGTTLVQPASPRLTWLIQFSNVPDGNGYTLDVNDTVGGGDEKTNISVAAGNCA